MSIYQIQRWSINEQGLATTDGDKQRCLRCGSAFLDTGWECTDCGFDNIDTYGPMRRDPGGAWVSYRDVVEHVADYPWLSTDRARLALFDAIRDINVGNPTDDKLILANLRKAGLWIGRLPETDHLTGANDGR